MPRNKQLVSINLSSKSGTRIESVFFTWAINAGKIIIVLTELIALSALGYRFWVDRQIIDLHDAIKKEQLLLKSQSEKEKDYRNVQTRLFAVNTLAASSQSKLDLMNAILNAVSQANFSSSDIAINGSAITLSGVSQSVFAVNSFVTTLKSNPKIRSINMDTFESANEGIKFRLILSI